MTNETAVSTNVQSADLAEQVAVVGDLAQLTAAQRMAYYSRVCDSLGINPFTQPFQYIRLNNKLVLYATRTAADQLRRRNGVSLDAPRVEFADGLVIVTVTGRDDQGRTDTEIGAVPLGNLQGEARANAIMKAVTKAKRRLTLSICGLGWLDETEVESIRDARPVTVTDDGEIVDAPTVVIPPPVAPAAQPATATPATNGNNPPVAAPDPATEEVYTEPRDKFIGIVARYLEISEDAVKERVRALGYTALSGKPDERVKLYQAIRAYEPPTAARDEPLFSLPAVDPA